MAQLTQINRREFLQLSTRASAGLVIGFHLPWARILAQTSTVFQPNVWLRIDPQGLVTITMHRSEMGQKVWTALPMIVAEELEADWSQVRVVQGDLDPVYGRQSTGGSASVRTCYDKLRRAGAVAREMLIGAAARTWGVPTSGCRAEGGRVIDNETGRELAYGELVKAAAGLPVPAEVHLKDPGEFRIIGREMKSLKGQARADGSAVYGFDFHMPGMLIAAVTRIPTFGGRVASYDADQAQAVAGVEAIVPISSGVTVVARDTWSALQGRKALRVTWDEGPNAGWNSDRITASLKKAAAEGKGTILRDDGDARSALKKAPQRLEATFEVPYLDHAPMEPMNCTARVGKGKCEIWAPTQNPARAQEIAGEVTGLPAEAVKVHTLLMGGGFGRRLQADFVRDAVEVAQALDAPVKVIRTRDEDIRHGFYRPATYHHLQGGLDKGGRPVAWIHRVSGPQADGHGLITGGADELAYAIPNVQVDYVMSDIPVPIGPWRSVANTQNALVNECFIDELALAAGQDPYQFRRNLLKAKHRHLGVLDLVAEKARWGQTLPGGHYQGIAVHFSFHSYAAMVAEISLDPDNHLKVHQVVCAIDCGTVINPDGVRAQVEGGIAMGLTAALYGTLTLQKGRIRQSNFHDYKLLTMKEMPAVETHLVPSEAPPTGVGEPPVPPTAPALLNALRAATGQRIYRLPIQLD